MCNSMEKRNRQISGWLVRRRDDPQRDEFWVELEMKTSLKCDCLEKKHLTK